jgi:hypothetical protein
VIASDDIAGTRLHDDGFALTEPSQTRGDGSNVTLPWIARM